MFDLIMVNPQLALAFIYIDQGSRAPSQVDLQKIPNYQT